MDTNNFRGIVTEALPGERTDEHTWTARNFSPPWWLASAHLQTLAGKFLRAAPSVMLTTERIETPDGDFLAARLDRVATLLEEDSRRFWPNQYANLDNPESHELGTIAEIDAALGGQIDVLYVACSSTGTARGCRDYLRRMGRKTKVVAVDAMGSTLFNGTAGPRKISGMGAGRIPELAKGQEFDDLVRVSDVTCVAGCRRAVAAPRRREAGADRQGQVRGRRLHAGALPLPHRQQLSGQLPAKLRRVRAR